MNDSELRSRVLQFLRARERFMPDGQAGWATNADAELPELFGLLDAIYSLYIVNGLTSAEHGGSFGEALVAWQDEDGWFRSGDAQGHHRLHVTAYALGALAIVSRISGRDFFRKLAPIEGFADDAQAALGGPDALSLLDRMHFWRGSHKSGGIAAVVGQMRDAGQAGVLLGLNDPDGWLDAWASRWESVARADGLWRFGSPLRELFYIPYRLRHREAYAVLGGAAHIYWIRHRLGLRPIAPTNMTCYILDRASDADICEAVPYCLDFDRLCLLAYSLPHLGDADPAGRARALIARSGSAIRAYFLSRPESEWFASSHKLPGALAALAVAQQVGDTGDDDGLRDVFDVVWWL